MKKWSEEAWEKALPVYNSILDLPFVRELASGTLSRERFLFYITQDSLYIDNYSRILAHIASRLPEKAQMEDFLKFATDGILVEKALHDTYLGDKPRDIKPTPTCLLYNSYESSKMSRPVEVEAASILPCFWVYQRVGEHILRESSTDNPYSQWIDTYADEAFAISNRRAIAICDELAVNSSQAIRNEMTEVFEMSTRMEWMFWESAYKLEKWKI